MDPPQASDAASWRFTGLIALELSLIHIFPDVVEDYMAQISRLTGREYHLFNYYGAPDAERVIVAMGSVSGCAQEVVNYLNARGEKVGCLLYTSRCV